MSEENVEIVRRGYDAFARRDLDALLEDVDAEVVSYVASPLPDPAEHHGHRGFLRWIENWAGSFERLTIEVQELIDAGDSVIVRTLQCAVGPESGAEVSQIFWFVHTLRDRKLIRVGVHATEQEAREAAGLSG